MAGADAPRHNGAAVGAPWPGALVTLLSRLGALSWAVAFYTAYGYYTSINGAIATWAVIAALS